jgi:formylglycine-generating enzyme required for sulfatase activity
MLQKGGKVGDYTLVRFLGRGQFGVVWLAEKEIALSHRKFRHALKFLPSGGDEAALKLIQAEIDTWVEASGHPNVMSVLDMMLVDGHIVIASEYADSGSLMDWLTRSNGKAPSHEKALQMMSGILSGIEHLHSRNVVHRDLKPDNILLQGNTPRITDFGISRIVSANSLSAVAMGSPFYMSPEAFDGGKSRQTDIWSAGVILYELLTGTHPYKSDTIYGLVSAIRQEQPKPLPDTVPVGIRAIVETALQKDLTRRYRSAKDMRWAVEQEVINLKTLKRRTGNLNKSGEYVDPTAITLFDAKLDLTELEAPPQPEPEIAASPESPVVSTAARPAGVRSSQSIEIRTQEPMPVVPATVQPFQNTQPDLTSQIMAWRKPVLIAAGLGSAATVLLVVGLISFFAAAKAIFFGSSVSTTPSPATNTIAADPRAQNVREVSPGMAFVEGGRFMMGRDNALVDESPAHPVEVKSFFIDIYEVTNEDYAKFVQATNRLKLPQGWENGSYGPGEGGRHPVVGVTWNDANAYASWIGKRLPTEEEWEFAARGQTGFLYPWGNEWAPGLANADGAAALAEVGKFSGKSPFGLFDMVGNAGEWTASEFRAYDGGRLSPGYSGLKNLKSVRGNGFDAKKEEATAVSRFGWRATGAEDYSIIGFRCAKDVGR